MNNIGNQTPTEIQRPRATLAEKMDAMQEYMMCGNIREVAEKFDRECNTVTRWAKKYDWIARRRDLEASMIRARTDEVEKTRIDDQYNLVKLSTVELGKQWFGKMKEILAAVEPNTKAAMEIIKQTPAMIKALALTQEGSAKQISLHQHKHFSVEGMDSETRHAVIVDAIERSQNREGI